MTKYETKKLLQFVDAVAAEKELPREMLEETGLTVGEDMKKSRPSGGFFSHPSFFPDMCPFLYAERVRIHWPAGRCSCRRSR